MFWVGSGRKGNVILERCYDTLEEANNDYFINRHGKYSRSEYVVVETNDPDQWEADNNIEV